LQNSTYTQRQIKRTSFEILKKQESKNMLTHITLVPSKGGVRSKSSECNEVTENVKVQ